tara:strand:+ start:1186 stop:3294 length:2109 start_codon:yes stop_codon:yes gene_type:complete
MATKAPTIEDMRSALLKKQQEGLAVQSEAPSESAVTSSTEPTVDDMRASLIAQQQPQELQQVTSVPEAVSVPTPIVEEASQDVTTDSDGEEVSPSQNLNVQIYTAMARAGAFANNKLQGADEALMSKWQGEIASMPFAMKGAELAAKLPVGHPLLKTLTIAAGSATGALVGTFMGELGEDVYNGTPLEYTEAFEAGVETAKWDAAGGLIIKGIGTLSSKALRSAGITSTGEAVIAARELLQKHGTDLSWFQATGSTLSSLVEGISVVAIGGRKILDDAFAERELALKQELDTFLSGSTPAVFGQHLTEIVKKSNKTLRETFNPQYARIYEQGKDIPVYALTYNRKIQGQIAARTGAEKIATAKEPNAIINQSQNILTNLKQITNVGDLSETIKKLNALKRQAGDVSKTVEGKATGSAAESYINKEIKELREMLGDASKKMKPELKKELDFLDLTYARQKQLLHSQTMKKVMSENPSAMGAYVHSTPEAAGEFMRFLGNARKQGSLTKEGHTKILEEYRSGYIKSILKTEGDGTTVANMATLYSKLGDVKELAQMKAVLGGPQSKRLMTVLKTADIVKDSEAGKFGLMYASNASTAIQGAAALTAGGITGLAALLIAPQALARAAGSARTMGQWLSLTRLYKATAKDGDRAAIAMATKRILEWSNADPEDAPDRTSARQVPQQRQAPPPQETNDPRSGMFSGM